MSMTIEFSANAIGHDEHEALACALETAARSLRMSQDDYPSDAGDEEDNVMSPQSTAVEWSFTTTP